MRSLSLFGLVICLLWCTACQESSSKEKHAQASTIALEELEGYWEIAFVTHANETFYPKKGGAPLWDYYELDTTQGFRKKGQPLFDGRFQASKATTAFSVEHRKEGYTLVFQTPLDQWEEKLIYVDSVQLVLEHHDKNYHYNRRKLK